MLDNKNKLILSKGKGMSMEKLLFKAIDDKDERSLIDLVLKGADVNAFNDKNQTPLMVASDKGFKNIAQKLLILGADINKASDYGRTALSYAISGHIRDIEMVQLLVENGADIHSKVPKKDGFYSLRPLVQAILYSDEKIVSYLLEKGAEGKEEALPFLNNQKNSKMIELLEGKKQKPAKNLSNFLKYLKESFIDKNLKKAIKPEITELFLMKKIEQKKDISLFMNEFIKNYHIKTSVLLHWATKHNCVGTMDMLIKLGFPLNYLWYGERTPLGYAVLNGNLSAAKLLIKNGADIHLTDRFGETVLHRAVFYSDKAMVDLLIKSGANINQESGSCLYQTPLMIAAEQKDVKMVKYLIEKGADVNFVSSDGKTALYWALLGTKQTDVRLLEALYQGGVNLNQSVCLRKHYQATPLEIASLYNDKSAVKFLLDKKANGNELAFFVAKQNNNKQMMRLLDEKRRLSFQRTN